MAEGPDENVERPYRLGLGDQLWEEALQRYADPELQESIRAAKGFKNETATIISGNPPRDMSKNIQAVRENITHFLIREAAKNLYDRGQGRILPANIASLLTTGRYAISQALVGRYLDKYPKIVEYYSIESSSPAEVNRRYGDAITALWKEKGRRPKLAEIARKLNVKPSGVQEKLHGRRRDANPQWLLDLYERGPNNKKP